MGIDPVSLTAMFTAAATTAAPVAAPVVAATPVAAPIAGGALAATPVATGLMTAVEAEALTAFITTGAGGVPALAPTATPWLTLEKGLVIGSTALSGGAAVSQSQAQNRALAASKGAAKQAGLENQRQIRTAASQQHERRVDEFNQLSARILVARGEAGVGLGGSTAAVTRQAEFDTAEDLSAINLNAALGGRRVATGVQAQMAQLDSQQQNPLLSAFLGGMQGAGQGLKIARGFESLQRLGKEGAT